MSNITDFLYMGVKDGTSEYTLCTGVDLASQFAVSETAVQKPDCDYIQAKLSTKVTLAVLGFLGGLVAAYLSMRISDKIAEAWDDFLFGVSSEELAKEVPPEMKAKFVATEQRKRMMELEELDRLAKEGDKGGVMTSLMSATGLSSSSPAKEGGPPTSPGATVEKNYEGSSSNSGKDSQRV